MQIQKQHLKTKHHSINTGQILMVLLLMKKKLLMVHCLSTVEYSNNYSDSSGSLWQLKRGEIATKVNVCNANNSSFKYKSINLVI